MRLTRSTRSVPLWLPMPAPGWWAWPLPVRKTEQKIGSKPGRAFMARLQTVDKASQSFLPAGKKSVQSFSPAACTSAKIFLAQMVSICALPAHMRHGSERKPSRRQSQKDFVNDLRPSLHGPAFALPGTDVPPWLPPLRQRPRFPAPFFTQLQRPAEL